MFAWGVTRVLESSCLFVCVTRAERERHTQPYLNYGVRLLFLISHFNLISEALCRFHRFVKRGGKKNYVQGSPQGDVWLKSSRWWLQLYKVLPPPFFFTCHVIQHPNTYQHNGNPYWRKQGFSSTILSQTCNIWHFLLLDVLKWLLSFSLEMVICRLRTKTW